MDQSCVFCGTGHRKAVVDRDKLVLAAVIVALAVLVARSDVAHAFLESLLEPLGRAIQTHPVGGALIFTVLAAVAAMLAFFSTAPLVPIAVHAFGTPWAIVLLWLGWVLGAGAAFAIGSRWGMRAVRHLVDPHTADRYAGAIQKETRPWMLLLFQLALPSEVPGYLAGTIHYPLRRFLPIVALAELPYAVATVYLGDSFLDQDLARMTAILVGGLLVSSVALFVLHRRIHA